MSSRKEVRSSPMPGNHWPCPPDPGVAESCGDSITVLDDRAKSLWAVLKPGKWCGKREAKRVGGHGMLNRFYGIGSEGIVFSTKGISQCRPRGRCPNSSREVKGEVH